MKFKQTGTGILTVACLTAAAMLLPQVGWAQDEKVKVAMELLKSMAINAADGCLFKRVDAYSQRIGSKSQDVIAAPAVTGSVGSDRGGRSTGAATPSVKSRGLAA